MSEQSPWGIPNIDAKYFFEICGRVKKYDGVTCQRIYVSIWNDFSWYRINKWCISFHFDFNEVACYLKTLIRKCFTMKKKGK